MNDLLEKQFQAWQKRAECTRMHLEPVREVLQIEQPGTVDTSKLACVVLAGGMGSRLGLSGPKGAVRVPAYGNKTLFDIMLEKTEGLPVAVMTSPLNHNETQKALSGSSVELFSQEMLPVLDESGNWIGKKPLSAPDGNGKVFANLAKAGILERWKKQGIQYISIISIDNPKADPKNVLQLSSLENGADLAVSAIEAHIPDEKTGVLALNKGHLHVAEYSEQQIEGPYRYPGLFACTLPFAEKAAQCSIPWHLAYKKFENRDVWKFEYFIFDLFQYAKSFKIVYQPRKDCFAPIKVKEDLL